MLKKKKQTQITKIRNGREDIVTEHTEKFKNYKEILRTIIYQYNIISI